MADAPRRRRLRGACWPPGASRSSSAPPRRSSPAAGGRSPAGPTCATPATPRTWWARRSAAFGRLDGVVLNAGASTIAAAAEEDLAAFADVLAVNVTAQMALASRGRPAR